MPYANRLTTVALAITCAALIGVVAKLAQDIEGGPLDPPGPPASTQSVIEPRTAIVQPVSPATFPIVISTPGSYYLAGNITGVSGQPGIQITTSDVTLDLNGFTLGGVAGSTVGILVSGALSENITIRNGVVTNWSAGIDAATNENGRYFDLQLLDNSGLALKASSASTIVRVTAKGGTSGVRLTAALRGGLILDSVIAGSSFPISVEGTNVVIRRTSAGPGAQGVNHSGAALWLDQSQVWSHNFGYVLDGNTAIVTRNTILQNAGFAGIGTNNHIGSNAAIGTGTVSSTDAWSNVRY